MLAPWWPSGLSTIIAVGGAGHASPLPPPAPEVLWRGVANHLYDALFARGAAEAPALIVGERMVGYGELRAWSGRMAASFAAAGVKPGDRIAASLDKSAAGLAAYLGALAVGAAWLPLNPAYTAAELGYFLVDAEPSLVLADPARREALAGLPAARIETLDGAGAGSLADLARAAPADFATVQRRPSDLAAICYTSGTTGRSKGAMLSHGNLLANAQVLAELWRFSERDRLVHALPLHHVHGLFVATHVLMLAGGAIVLEPRFDAAAVLAAMADATALMGVPTFYTRLLAHPGLDRAAVANMRLFISGSAPLLTATFEAWRERTGAVILERYGLTETGMNTSNPYTGERIAGTVGHALPGVTLRLVDEAAGAPAGAGQVGMIQVAGPNVFSGYWRDAERTAEAFTSDGFFITGDLGRFDETGHLTIVGRAKDLVICGGANVYPKEVESLIDALPGVAESAVFGLPHADLGEAVTAIVVPAPGAELSEAAILAAIAPNLARFKQPRRVLFASDLPRNAMGKVQKAELRAAHAGLYG